MESTVLPINILCFALAWPWKASWTGEAAGESGVFDLDDFYSVQVVKQIRITTSASANPQGNGTGCTSNSAEWFFLRWKLRWICSFLAWAGKAGACVHHVQGLAQSSIRKRKQVTSVRQGLSHLTRCSGQDLMGGMALLITLIKIG